MNELIQVRLDESLLRVSEGDRGDEPDELAASPVPAPTAGDGPVSVGGESDESSPAEIVVYLDPGTLLRISKP